MSQADAEGDSWFARYFEFDRYNTDMRTEVLAGLTTFLTMSYIIVVNPAILSDALLYDHDAGELLTETTINGTVYTEGEIFQMLAVATILASLVGILIMAFWAKRPFGLAPGMGLNAFFAFTVVIAMGIPWQTALAAVFVEGIIFILITAVGARRWVIEMFPQPVKLSVGAGIGAFLLLIGLQQMEIVVVDGGLDLGQIAQNPWALLGIFGLIFTLMIYARGVRGSIVIGILGTALLGWGLTLAGFFERGEVTPAELASPQYDITPLAGAFIDGFAEIEPVTFALVVFTFFFVDFFDTAGVLVGLGNQAGLTDEDGDLPDMEKPLMADAVATTFGSMVGTSTTTTFIESATGIDEGGRTGMTALTIGAFFLVALIAVPLVVAIPGYAIYLALIIVGLIMLQGLADIDWTHPAWVISAGLTIFIMPLTESIAYGIAAGLITYPLVKFAMGESEDLHPAHWALAVAFVIYFYVQTSGLVG